MESAHPPADSQVSRVPAQRTPPGQATGEPATPPRPQPPPRRRLRRTLVAIGAAMAVFCLAGAAIAYIAYDRYTAPDRSSPVVVVENFLQAYLVARNDVLADQMACSDSSLDELRVLRDELRSREERFGVTFEVHWGALDVQTRDARAAEVSTELQMRYAQGGLFQVDHQRWRFLTRDDGGWLVCEASRIT